MGFMIGTTGMSQQQSAYYSYQATANALGGANPYLAKSAGSEAASAASLRLLKEKQSARSIKNQLIKDGLRNMESGQTNNAALLTGEQKSKMNYAFTGTLTNKQTGFLETKSTSKTSEDNGLSTVKKYDASKLSNAIMRAKTSISAGQAATKARREVISLKRQIASGKGDVGELNIALTHAKRMERAAKKKKHHLELEELVEAKQKGLLAQEDEHAGDGGMRSDLYEQAEDKLSDAAYEIDDMQQEAVEDFLEENGLLEDFSTEDVLADVYEGLDDILNENIISGGALAGEALPEDMISDEMLEALDELLEEFGADEQEMLEEMQEQIALLETVDPKMSEEDLKELKMKHRQSERKDIVRADMDYLKDMFEHMDRKSAAIRAAQAAQTAGGGKSAGFAEHAGTKSAGEASLTASAYAATAGAAAVTGAYEGAAAAPSGGFDIVI